MLEVAGFRFLQPGLQGAGAALDLKASRQLAGGLHPAIDAVEHHSGKTVQPVVERGFVQERSLVGSHDFGDR